jgi:hypothetical protein
LEVEITLNYNDAKIAKAIAKAVSPDNFKTPKGLIVKTVCEDAKVFTFVQCENGLSTLIATIDDLLSCVLTAEKTLQTMKMSK